MSALNWIHAELTHAGLNPRKQVNEDYVGFNEPTDPQKLQQRGALYVVADGIGGEAHGEVASRMAFDTLTQAYYDAPPGLTNQAALAEAIARANAAILARSLAEPQYEGMGTTLTVAALKPDGALLLANVGDSRAYLIRGGQPAQLTADHTWVAEQVKAGVMTPEEARTSRRRHEINRSVGRRPEVTADFVNVQLLPDDRLLMCSDGLSDLVLDHEIAAGALRPVGQAVQGLVDLANSRGGTDNITVQLLHYAPGKASPALNAPPARKAPVLLLALGAVLAVALLAVAAWLVWGRGAGAGPDTATVTPGAPALLTPAAAPAAGLTALPGSEASPAVTGEGTSQGVERGPTSTLAPGETRVVPTKVIESGGATTPTQAEASRTLTLVITGLDEARLQCGAVELLKDGKRANLFQISDLIGAGGLDATQNRLEAALPLGDATHLRYVGSSDGHCPWDTHNLKQSGWELDGGQSLGSRSDLTLDFFPKPSKPKTGGGAPKPTTGAGEGK